VKRQGLGARGWGLGLCLLLAASAAFAGVPAPEELFGHRMGADRTVLEWAQVVSYFQALGGASDRIRVEELGKSTEGRPFIVATIAAPDTLRNLDRYREIQRRLADPRLLQLGGGKAVVLVTCSIHATELASTASAVEFAYRLVTEDTPRMRAIRENDIVLLVPSLNPDGVDIVARWYKRTLGTPFEGTGPPELYQKYIGHDNNRDWYMFSQKETQLTVAKLHNVWHPQIVYDLHQHGAYAARLFVPPWMDPTEPNIDAILMQETNMIGTAMAADLTAAGRQGIAIHALYDFWTPSRHYSAFHGGMRILTESASAKLATPITVAPEQLERGNGYDAREPSWNFLEPWGGGTWRQRDIVDDQLIAMESCLYQAAIHREELLENFYKIGQRQAARKSPWGFVIPAAQRDAGATAKLLETLAFGQVEIEHTAASVHVVRMAQPYSGWAKALLERQHYPDLRQYPGGPPVRPYDATAHTLPLLMGVRVETAEAPVAGLAPGILPRKPAVGMPGSDTDSWRVVNAIWARGGAVWRNMETGDFAAADAGAGWKQVARPRIGLYRSFVPNSDEGWTRWLLEQFGFAYASLQNKEVQAGGLRKHFDVIVFPDATAQSMEHGHKAGSMPEEFTGGLEERGAAALREFCAGGGTLIFLNRATEYATEHLSVAARNVVRGVAASEFYSPGSLLNVRLDTRHPLALGLPAEIAIWSEHSPAFATGEAAPARYAEDHLLASGWLLGEKYLAREAALVDARVGGGHVVLFGMRPQYRAQSYQTFKLFFNALVY